MEEDDMVSNQGSDFAWQVHAALNAWTERADGKASIMLAFQGAALVLLVPASDGAGRLGSIPIAAAGVTLLAAMGVALTAIMPMLGSARAHRKQADRNMVYFGHLRLWQARALAVRLGHLSPADESRMLSQQLIIMSRIAWQKHRLLQVSAGLTATALITAVAPLLRLLTS
jgi:hypothetical protein